MDRPEWLTLPVPDEEELMRMKRLLDAGHLHTVCESAECPNMGECFGNRTCTFMILGDICTRNCRFCAVSHGRPAAVDENEPQAVALTARQLGLKHVVVTSVTRDDLPDGGAGHFAATIRALRREVPEATVEVLIPDFRGEAEALYKVIEAGPDVINHNVETVPRLYPSVRPQAVYFRSLDLLRRVGAAGGSILTKSGLMLGLGETSEEVVQVMADLREAGCQVVTMGQYLCPSPRHLPVVEYITPDTFKSLEETGYEMGFAAVHAGPLVRSSYLAGQTMARLQNRCQKERR
ncbi:MAG: lipoyl synthase [Syntrophomonadaceae bacterium]|nr:lipoyl synthase [Syntrophomonadaceae bacterium]